MTNWATILEIGDKVIVKGHFSESIEKIQRITKTLFITDSGGRFNKTTLATPGGGYYHSFLYVWSQEAEDGLKEKAAKRKLVIKLKDTNWNNLPFTVLLKINEFL